MEEKVEMYKNRTLGERFSATSDFVRGNWRVLANNLLPVGLILALPMGFFIQYYLQGAFTMINNPAAWMAMNWWAYAGVMIVSIVFSLFIYATTGAILNKYAKGTLTPETGWADLQDHFFSIAGKILIQSCIIALVILVVSAITGLIVWLFPHGSGIVALTLTVLPAVIFSILIFICVPALSLIYYPLYFEQVSAWKGIMKGFRWGFKYWGSTFVSVFLGAFLFMVGVYILSMPYIIYIVFKMGAGGWLGYLLSMLMFAVVLVLQPLYIVFVALQYTSIASRLSCDN